MTPLPAKTPVPASTSSAVKVSYRYWLVLTYQYAVWFMCRGGRCQSSAKAMCWKPMIGRTFSWPT